MLEFVPTVMLVPLWVHRLDAVARKMRERLSRAKVYRDVGLAIEQPTFKKVKLATFGSYGVIRSRDNCLQFK